MYNFRYICKVLQNIIRKRHMSSIQKKSLLRYLMPAIALGVFAFLMVAYGSAYTPPKAQKQRIVCFKFKQGTSQEAIKQHMQQFQELKRDLPEIVSYSAGNTLSEKGENADYDVLHYLTFRTDGEMEKFRESAQYKAFEKSNEANWEKVLVINSEIK
ncbi:Dabb family protein [Emticicia sp. 21SJ11W-3]|uniref:Dabb family protein n=1 Tax=Emticicia sp. 21SJ11W-3 TaxID=2916755 RepID=UPI00209FC4CF|nr:Dabb family protein [Emticicia sp. 21SJ11W-3]UTA69503.1 Dabb family protein [Emticicia sp. 21SJ11W-3]